MTLYNFESNILYSFFKVMQEYENCEDGLIYVEGKVNIPPLEGKRREELATDLLLLNVLDWCKGNCSCCNYF